MHFLRIRLNTTSWKDALIECGWDFPISPLPPNENKIKTNHQWPFLTKILEVTEKWLIKAMILGTKKISSITMLRKQKKQSTKKKKKYDHSWLQILYLFSFLLVFLVKYGCKQEHIYRRLNKRPKHGMSEKCCAPLM